MRLVGHRPNIGLGMDAWFSLNWTTRSSAILAGQWQLHAHPAKKPYLSLPPTRQDSTQGQSPKGRLKVEIRGSEVGHEPRLRPCSTLLVISSLSAMWAQWALLAMLKLDNKVQCYTCWSMAVACPTSQKAKGQASWREVRERPKFIPRKESFHTGFVKSL